MTKDELIKKWQNHAHQARIASRSDSGSTLAHVALDQAWKSISKCILIATGRSQQSLRANADQALNALKDYQSPTYAARLLVMFNVYMQCADELERAVG